MEDLPVLLFDGDCRFCRRWVQWCKDREAQVVFRPCREATDLRARWGIPDGRCQETALFIDEGGVRTHQDAVHAVLRRIPGRSGLAWRTMGRMGQWPGLHALGGLTYHAIAKNRHRLGGPGP